MPILTVPFHAVAQGGLDPEEAAASSTTGCVTRHRHKTPALNLKTTSRRRSPRAPDREISIVDLLYLLFVEKYYLVL